MSKYLKHIAPKTKILFVSFILVLVPVAIISYLSLRSIKQKAENLRTKYSGTVNLIRDKLENEVSKLETNLRNSAIRKSPETDKATDLKEWLRKIESGNPGFNHLFLVNSEGGLISSSVSLRWNKPTGVQQLENKKAEASFYMAEKSEFVSKNYRESISFYKDALAYSASLQDRVLLYSRIGRCYFKLGDYRKAVDGYKKIDDTGNPDITIGNIPASIVALYQITDCYEAMKAEEEYYFSSLELYKRLLNNPWDLEGGEYLYYLKSAGERIRSNKFHANDSVTKNIEDLNKREKKILEEINSIEFIERNVLSEIESELGKFSTSDLRPFDIVREVNDTTFQFRFFRLPGSEQLKSSTLSYQFDYKYILSTLFPEVLASVDLGKDVFVGILDEKDSLLYSQLSYPVNKFLAADNFTQPSSGWKVALFDPEGKSIEQLTGKERLLYLLLFLGIIIVMLIGIILIVRAVIHESEISRMKSEFVSNVSHELKTPLSLIRMFGETLDSGIVTEEKDRKKFYTIIRKESERLTHLINNVLDFSRMDAGVKEYNFQETDLVEVIRSSLEAYKFQISDSGFRIEGDLPDEPLYLKFDREAIAQVLLNLLNNAVKYSDDDKYILVKVSKDSSSAFVSVTDHGIGIPKDELKRVFDKFYRGSNERTKETQGSGLGLTLARNIVVAHGGTIEVESEVGKGSRFTVRIPL